MNHASRFAGRPGIRGLILAFVLGVVSPAQAGTDLSELLRQLDVAWQSVVGTSSATASSAGAAAVGYSAVITPQPIGVAMTALTESDRIALGIADGRGVRITQVVLGGIADGLGIKPDDIVVGFNGTPVHAPEELASAVRSRDPSITPSVELHIVSARQSIQAAQPEDCGPNPTPECAIRKLRGSWKRLREAVR
jgi:S1-C subfamily serine protease